VNDRITRWVRAEWQTLIEVRSVVQEASVLAGSHRRSDGGVASRPAAVGESAEVAAKVLAAIEEGPKDQRAAAVEAAG